MVSITSLGFWGNRIYEMIALRYEVSILLIFFVLMILLLRSMRRQKKFFIEFYSNVESINEHIEGLKIQLNEISDLQNKKIEKLSTKISAIRFSLEEMREKEKIEMETLINDATSFREELFSKSEGIKKNKKTRIPPTKKR